MFGLRCGRLINGVKYNFIGQNKFVFYKLETII
jgi:hypothetical protein